MPKFVLGSEGARKFRELCAARSAGGRRKGGGSAPVADSGFAAPFSVRWARSADGGAGAWIIWIPSSSVLVVDGEPVDLTSDLTDAGDPYPEGWYLLDDMPAAGGSLYLNVTPGDPEASPPEDAEAELSASASQTEGDIPILIATAAVDSTTGAVTVKQTVASALVFGTGSGGAAAAAWAKPFDYSVTESESGTVRTVAAGSFYYNNALQAVPAALTVTGSGSETAYLVGTPPVSASDSFTFALALAPSQASGAINMKLYDFEDGEVVKDYRDTFLAIPATAYAKNEFKTLYLGAGSGDPVELGKIVASQNATIMQKTLVEGSGISITESADGKTLTISATGGGGGSSTSGYTTPSGSEDVTIAALKYDTTNHQMLVKCCRETHENGLLKTRAVDSAWSLIEGGQAVAETV